MTMIDDPNAVAIYNALSPHVVDVAVWKLGERHIIGRYVEVGGVTDAGYVQRIGKKAIKLLGDGKSWQLACARACLSLGMSLDADDKKAGKALAQLGLHAPWRIDVEGSRISRE